MTNLYPVGDITQTGGEGPGEPGAAPVGSSMQGNPQASQYTPSGAHVPGPQVTSAQLLATQIANGSVPLHTQPTNVNVTPGGDSLLAMMARGQIIRSDSTYGQGSLVQGWPGGQQGSSPNINPIATGPASGVTVASPPTYAGN